MNHFVTRLVLQEYSYNGQPLQEKWKVKKEREKGFGFRILEMQLDTRLLEIGVVIELTTKIQEVKRQTSCAV